MRGGGGGDISFPGCVKHRAGTGPNQGLGHCMVDNILGVVWYRRKSFRLISSLESGGIAFVRVSACKCRGRLRLGALMQQARFSAFGWVVCASHHYSPRAIGPKAH